MNQALKLSLMIVGIFLAGVVSGYFVYPQVAQMRAKPKPHAAPEQWGVARIKKLSEKLGLTTEQEAKIKPIMLRDMAELGRIRTNCLAEAKKVLERTEHDIAELLTPEQNVKFEQMNREMREGMQRFIKDRLLLPRDGLRRNRERPEGGDAPPPPPPSEKPPGGV